MGLYSIKQSHYPLCHIDAEKQLKLDNKLKPGQSIHLIKSNLITEHHCPANKLDVPC